MICPWCAGSPRRPTHTPSHPLRLIAPVAGPAWRGPDCAQRVRAIRTPLLFFKQRTRRGVRNAARILQAFDARLQQFDLLLMF